MKRQLELLARTAVRLYPRPWRERYQDEVLGLLQSAPIGPLQALDLVRGCATEWRARGLERIVDAVPIAGRFLSLIARVVTSIAGAALLGLPGVGMAMLASLILRTTIGDGQGITTALEALATLAVWSILSLTAARFVHGPLSAEERRSVRLVLLALLVCVVLRQWGRDTRSLADAENLLMALTDAIWLGSLIQIERGWFRPIRAPRAPDEIIQLRLYR